LTQRYTIRYGILRSAQKLTTWTSKSIAHGTKTNKVRKTFKKKQKPGSSEETVRVIVREGSPEEHSETMGG